MNRLTKGFQRFNWTLAFLSSYQPESIGGQAVIEGVLMRSPRRLAVAVRAPDGSIVVDNKEFLSYSRRHKILSLPVFRGAASLIESLAIGVQALNFSMAVQEKGAAALSDAGSRASTAGQSPASTAGEKFASATGSLSSGTPEALSEAGSSASIAANANESFTTSASASAAGQASASTPANASALPTTGSSTSTTTLSSPTASSPAESSTPSSPKHEKFWIAVSLGTSLIFALGLFQLLPYWVAGHIVGGTKASPQNPLLFNLAAGAVRITLLLGYMYGISFLKDIGRVFQYHGAEHKSIFVHERGGPLVVAAARVQSRFHPRCGTSFILIVALVCMLFFAVLDGALWQFAHFTYPNALARFLVHLPFVPLVAGLSFEVLKLTAKFQDSAWVKPFIAPGLWLQKITTQEPDESQLEVAIASIQAALV